MNHPFEPIYNEQSKILILGTFPSPKSREEGFFYGHPRNRFWKLLTELTHFASIPKSISEKIDFLLKHQIAIWDTIQSCEVQGASDAHITNIIPADLSMILDNSKIEKIFANGTKAFEVYMKYCFPKTKREIIKLPSTSPANASYSFNRLVSIWSSFIYY